MSNVEAVVRSLVANKLGVDQAQVTREATFVEDLGADSLDSVELVLALEEEFEIDIPDEAATKIQTLGDILAYLESHPVGAAKLKA